ncbi:hypothetical protein [Chitinophaga sp. S165]|uniref:hypothetical protein n=1 Tax=Chitinophaga sp. S165 TaxID=2135462 RepID=UPI000D909988|nr:hypothetical protein [Chitinophaga sp. S165]PWV51498.1 hypothetical protein C7475_103107 [Chitinophaga sp. S165]
MKGKRIEGRCYKARTKRGLFRMKKKSREDLELYKYLHAFDYLDKSDACGITLVGDKPEIEIPEREGHNAAEKGRIIRMPNEEPAGLLVVGI